MTGGVPISDDPKDTTEPAAAEDDRTPEHMNSSIVIIRFWRNLIVAETCFGVFAGLGLGMSLSPSGGPSNNSPAFGVVMMVASIAVCISAGRSYKVVVAPGTVQIHRFSRRMAVIPLRDIKCATTVQRLRRSLALQMVDGRVRVFDDLSQGRSLSKEAIRPAGRAALAVNAAIARAR